MARKNKKKEVELQKENEEAKIKKDQPVGANPEVMNPKSAKAPEDDNKTQVAKKHKNWLSALMGGLVFVSSSAGLFFLYKYRKNFAL